MVEKADRWFIKNADGRKVGELQPLACGFHLSTTIETAEDICVLAEGLKEIADSLPVTPKPEGA